MNIELFSGIGHSLGDAIRIDFDPKTKPDIIADVRFLPLRPKLRPDHVHGSPPCKYFSNARARRYGLDMKGLGDSFELVAAFFHALDYLEAKHWTLETPGHGFLAVLLNRARFTYKVADYHHKPTIFYSDMKALRRSVIPKEILELYISNEIP